MIACSDYTELGKIVDCLDNQRAPISDEERQKRKGEVPYYGANGKVGYIDDFLFNEELLLLAEDGGSWGPNERCAYIVSGKSWVNNHAHVLRCGKNTDIRFLMYFLNYMDLRSYISGTTRGKLNQQRMNHIKVPLLEINKQRKISDILTRAEFALKKRRQTLRLADEFLKSAFLEMFGDPVKNPEKLDVVLCGTIASHVSSGSTPLGGDKIYLKEGILFIRSQNVLMNRLDLSDVAYISNEVHQRMKRTWVKKDDVLLNITGASIGRVAFYEGRDDTANVNQHVCIIRPDKNKILPQYLSFLISMPNYQKTILGKNAGATRQAFNFDQIKRFRIPLASIPEQQKFAGLVQKVEKLKEKQKQSETQLQNLFNSLMQRAFRGELRL